MIDCLKPTTRLAWLLGPIALGIVATAVGQEPPSPSNLQWPASLREALNVPAVAPERLMEDVRAASRVVHDEEASPASIAEARDVLARRGYEVFLPRFFAPQAVGAEGFRDLLPGLHQRARFAVEAIRELGRPTDVQMQFLKDHEQRMRNVAALLLKLNEAGGGSGVSVSYVIDAQRMALEARSWRLDAEGRLQAGDGGAADAR